MEESRRRPGAPKHRAPPRAPFTLLLGAIAGAVVGALLAVNLVIYSGIERGYEATPAEVFEQRPVVGVVAAALIVVCPLAGMFVAVRVRSRR